MMNSLLDLGLSRNAATIYLALLEVGQTSITKLQEQSNLHPQLIYNALDELERTHLASHVIERGKRIFQPASPTALLELQNERLGRLETALPSLLHKYAEHEQQSVFIFVGNADFQKARDRVLKSIGKGDTYYVINNGGKRFKQAMEGGYTKQEAERIKRGVHKKILDFADSFSETGTPSGEAEALSEYRYLPSIEGGPTSTLFGGDYLRINVWSEPVLTILIKNPELVKSYRQYFDVLWAQAVDPRKATLAS
jgi:sugar-specific transcriptional regulator TrmB